MESSLNYFNHRVHKAKTRWQRREFIGKWRRIVAKDPRWVAPHGASLRRELRDSSTHLIYVDALPRDPSFRGSSLESAVAAAIIRPNPLKRDTGYLSFLHTINHRDTLSVLLESLPEYLRPHGIRTLLGPAHLFPHLGSGVLASHWHLTPPLHTPYNPPYFSELCQSLMKPAETLQLYHLSADVSADLRPLGGSPATLSPLEPARLAQDLLPLLQVACAVNPSFSPPSAEEAVRMLKWLATSPLYGWLAEVEGQGVGFVLMQADLPGRRRGLRLRRREVSSGRLLFLGVSPDFRGRGIAHHLLSQALNVAVRGGGSRSALDPCRATRASFCTRFHKGGAQSRFKTTSSTATLYSHPLLATILCEFLATVKALVNTLLGARTR